MLHLPQGNMGYMSQPASQTSTQGKKEKTDRVESGKESTMGGGVNRCWKLNTGGKKNLQRIKNEGRE